jgi:hypothetical protein
MRSYYENGDTTFLGYFPKNENQSNYQRMYRDFISRYLDSIRVIFDSTTIMVRNDGGIFTVVLDTLRPSGGDTVKFDARLIRYQNVEENHHATRYLGRVHFHLIIEGVLKSTRRRVVFPLQVEEYGFKGNISEPEVQRIMLW